MTFSGDAVGAPVSPVVDIVGTGVGSMFGIAAVGEIVGCNDGQIFSSRFVTLEMHEGRHFNSLFDAILIVFSCLSLHILKGTDPISLFDITLNDFKLINCPICVGIVPVRSL